MSIVAILPEQVKGKGICSKIYKENEILISDKSPSHYLKNLYDKMGKIKKKVDRQIKDRHQIQRNLPYVIDSNTVLFAFKFRKSNYDKEKRGFVNVKYVRKIENSTIVLNSGETIATLSSEKSLINNKLLATTLLCEQLLITMRENETTIKYLTANLSSRI